MKRVLPALVLGLALGSSCPLKAQAAARSLECRAAGVRLVLKLGNDGLSGTYQANTSVEVTYNEPERLTALSDLTFAKLDIDGTACTLEARDTLPGDAYLNCDRELKGEGTLFCSTKR